MKKLVEKESKHKRILFFKKVADVIPLEKETLISLTELMWEGCAIDIEKVNQLRGKIEIPIYRLGDFWNMDEMKETFEKVKNKPDVVLSYSKKEKRWAIR